MFESYSRRRNENPLLRVQYEEENSKFDNFLHEQLKLPMPNVKTEIIDQN